MTTSHRIKIGFIGFGLIGGSIAKALKVSHPNYHISAYNRHAPKHSTMLDKALEDGTIDDIVDRVEEFSDRDIIFLCAPVLMNISYMYALKGIIKSSCIITDVGSVKGNIHEVVSSLELNANFIGGHPMTGSDRTSYEYASSRLMENAYYLLTPTPETPDSTIETIRQLVLDMGSIPFVLDNHRHDDITAAISHIPHIIAASLVNMVHENDDSDEHMKTFAAGGFKDITRIASSSPEMWQNICLSNSDSIKKFLDIYKSSLDRVERALNEHDEDFLYNIFESARNYRDSIPNTSSSILSKTHEIYVDIPDVPGIIAIIATILSSHSVSIRNIGILHNREFEQGVLRIEFYDQESVTAARAALSLYPYPVYDR